MYGISMKKAIHIALLFSVLLVVSCSIWYDDGHNWITFTNASDYDVVVDCCSDESMDFTIGWHTRVVDATHYIVTSDSENTTALNLGRDSYELSEFDYEDYINVIVMKLSDLRKVNNGQMDSLDYTLYRLTLEDLNNCNWHITYPESELESCVGTYYVE